MTWSYKPILAVLSVIFFSTLYSPPSLYAQPWTNGQAAGNVIGQPGFSSFGSATTSTGLNSPNDVTIDPATGKVFVADSYNNRVLRYPSIAEMSNGAAAEAVFGQPDFVSNGYGTTATTMSNPSSVAIDASGSLWVMDQVNFRILRFDNAATLPSGAAADGVLGKPDFVTGGGSPATASSLNESYSIFCKGTTLWVGDTGNYRVLRFDNAGSKPNGGSADAVLGEPNFTTVSYGAPTSATQLYDPIQIYVDGADNLWVVDDENSRVLMFPNASTFANGEAATLVLGQTSFTTRTTGLTASTFNSPYGVYGDGDGNIYVSDPHNHRILVFANAASLSNGAAASYVLGQTGFTADLGGDGASDLQAPDGLFFGATLLVADADNNRVVVYTTPMTLPLLLKDFTGRLQDNGQVLLQWDISGVVGGGVAELQYSTTDSSGFTTVLDTQLVDPAASGYSYVHVSPAKGANEYRIKLIAPDGSATYSSIVRITVGGSAGLSIYPNPAHNNVVLTLPEAGTAEIDVYNSTGMLVQRQVTGAAVNTMDVSSLAAGVYTVKIMQSGTMATGSFIKVS